MKNKVLIFSAPSGSGKTTIVQHLLTVFPELKFSVSATSRAPRGVEKDGEDYYFLTKEDFKARAERGEFIEWEEVYAGTCYGTLRSEVERLWADGKVVVFDVDVVGGVNIKEIMGDHALSIFVMPPSVEELKKRLEGRGTDTAEAIARRVAKAESEITYSPNFDKIIINDKLEDALVDAESTIREFLR